MSRVIGYIDDNNGRRAIKRHVPQKYMMWFEDIKDIVKRHVQSDVPQDDAILLKELGLYCFLLRCKMPGAESFIEWAVETVLPRDFRKLASAIEEKDAELAHRDDQITTLTNEEQQQAHQQAIEEKDAALGLLNDDIQDRENQMQAIQYKNMALQAQRDVYQTQLLKCQDTITHPTTHYVIM